MSRILLINPPKDVPLLDWAMRYPPLGLMSVAAVLKGHEVEILDMKVDRLEEKDIRRKMRSADIVGISVLTPSVDSALELCKLGKQCGCLTVLGGVHPSLVPQLVDNPEVDIVVRGEGELSFKEIADSNSLDSIEGISYKNGNKVVHNPDRISANLSDLPYPRRDLVSKYKSKYMAWGKRLDALSTARGCPYRCSFCCVPNVWEGYRERTPREVINEIKQTDADAEIIAFVDDNFCFDMKRVEEICDLIIQEGLNDRLYSCFSRIDSIVKHPDVVAKMFAANMRVVFIGIEAASQSSLDKMKKKTKLDDIYKACRILEEKGIMIWAGHIIGNLDDKYEDVTALIQLSKSLPIDIAQYTVITPYPGTELYETAKEKNLIDEFDFTEYCECEPPMHTPHLSRMELLELVIKGYLEFYGFWAGLKRIRRWSKNPAKKWLLNKNMRTFSEFGKFKRKCAFYFVRAYKEMLSKTEGTKTDKTPLLVGPRLYSISSGVIAGLITLLTTISLDQGYCAYTSLHPLFIVTDIVIASLITSLTTAFVATWLAVKLYLRGWILSLRPRNPAKTRRTLVEKSKDNALHYGIIAFTLMAFLSFFTIITGFYQLNPSRLFWIKEIPLALIAFLISLIASFKSIDAVRNREITVKT
jgi:anaerobic magnesium-protoporphyrin IX monomethyl ester cyclase